MSGGRYHTICDRCGFKYWNHETSKEWTGLRVCGPCRDYRNPQDFVRGRADRQSVPDPRPRPTDVFLEIGDVTEDSL